jgi:hypothetical protein
MAQDADRGIAHDRQIALEAELTRFMENAVGRKQGQNINRGADRLQKKLVTYQ